MKGGDEMQIERVNENQIRCTLTKEDLESRNINIAELAYGSDNARRLFNDMMRQASAEVGFELDDIPIMIEAVPINAENLVLIITKVDFPDELDTRFSHFSPSNRSVDHTFSNQPGGSEGADAILDLYKRLIEGASKDSESFIPLKDAISSGFTGKNTKASSPGDAHSITKLFRFKKLDDIIRVAQILNGFYSGQNTLYKNPVNDEYELLVAGTGTSPEDFNKVCNILSEYGTPAKNPGHVIAMFDEHNRTIRRDDALGFFARLA